MTPVLRPLHAAVLFGAATRIRIVTGGWCTRILTGPTSTIATPTTETAGAAIRIPPPVL